MVGEECLSGTCVLLNGQGYILFSSVITEVTTVNSPRSSASKNGRTWSIYLGFSSIK
jgi:hypothetical protein